MVGTYILYNNDDFNGKIVESLLNNNFEKRIDTTDDNSDKELHKFVVESIFNKYTDIEKLIIPLKIGNYDYLGLKIALHIRLNSEIGDKNLIPLIIYSYLPENSIYYENQDLETHPAYILNRKGIALVDNISDLKAEIEAIEPLTTSEYNDFLKALKIDTVEGKHSLANFWGAYRLDQIISGGQLLSKRGDLIDKQKSLHFKYLQAFNSSTATDEESSTIVTPIESTGKKILLVDDEHNKGWTEVLSTIFKDANFNYVNREGKTYDAYIEEIKQEIHKDWDLILLDLRLNPSEEDNQANYVDNPIEFSGTKILQEIKSINIGTQVIIFTASNKAWNMHKLMSLGADGYYIKETPEFNFSNKITKLHYENLNEDVFNCYKKGFLRDHFKIQQELDDYLTNEISSASSNDYSDFLSNLNSQFKLAFDSSLAINFDKESTIDIAFIMYFQCFEVFKDYYISHHNIKYKANSDSSTTYAVSNITQESSGVRHDNLFSIVNNTSKNHFDSGYNEDYLKKLQIFIWKRNDYIHKNKSGSNFKKEHFNIDELKEIVDILYKLIYQNLKA